MQKQNEIELDPFSELGLVRKAMNGDKPAFSSLYKKYHPVVHAIALTRVPPFEAQDLVQDVFTKAWLHLPSLKKPNSFKSWLFTMARNRAIDFHRRNKDTTHMIDDLKAAPSRRSEALELLKHINSMRETYRETLIMRLVEGMTGPEIAQVTGMTPDSVRVNLHRGMALLRKSLKIEEAS